MDESDEIEFIGINIARPGEKRKEPAPEGNHATERGVRGGKDVSLATPTSLVAKPKLRRVLHAAAARSVINQILADKESNSEDPTGMHSASSDEGLSSSIRLQAPRWDMGSSSQNTTPSAFLPTPTAESSLSFQRSALGAKPVRFAPPASTSTSTRAFGLAVPPSSSVSSGFGSFAKFGTLGFASTQVPHPSTAPSSAGTGTESGQPIGDGDGS
jgi:hypothetical protein